MSFADTFSKAFRPSNIGTFSFFTLNLALILAVFYPYSLTLKGVMIIITLYIASIAVSLSPVGEWVISIFAGAKEIKRKDVQIKLLPLIELVYNKAIHESPNMVDSIHLKTIPGNEVNAYALGRNTICVTEGLLILPDEIIMGIFAHEVGHLANRHSEIQLLFGGANALITCFLFLLKVVSWSIAGALGIISLNVRSCGIGCVTGALAALTASIVTLWTKLCMLFLCHSMRQNEYEADSFACNIGYGMELAIALDYYISDARSGGMLGTLYAKHPSRDDRIARIQNQGVNYSRY